MPTHRAPAANVVSRIPRCNQFTPAHRPDRCPQPDDSQCLCRERDRLTAWLGPPRRRLASRDDYAQFIKSPAALNAAWVSFAGTVGDSSLRWQPKLNEFEESLLLATAWYQVALDLVHRQRTARWWEGHVPNPRSFPWELLWSRVRYKGRRAVLKDRERGAPLKLEAPDPAYADQYEQQQDGGATTNHETLACDNPLACQSQIEARLDLELLAARAPLTRQEGEVFTRVMRRGGPEYGVLKEVAVEMERDASTVRVHWHKVEAKLRRAAGG